MNNGQIVFYSTDLNKFFLSVDNITIFISNRKASKFLLIGYTIAQSK